MNARTCFDILRITRDATLDEAKESYKRLVKLWHPDQYVNFPEKHGVAQEKLKEINVAYRDIVAILKRHPVENEALSNEKDTQPPVSFSRDKKRKLPTFWNQVSQFINTTILKSSQEGTKEDTHTSPGSTRYHGAASIGGGGIGPDFEKILERTVRGKRLNAGGRGRNRHGNMKHVRRQFRNAAAHRIEANARPSHGDRVEKITPVGRVNRIGGD